VDQDAFHRRDDERAKGSLLPASRVGLPLTPPTRSPHEVEEVLSRGIASTLRRANPVENFERADAFVTRWITRA